MKILITGSTGMLGRECKTILNVDHELVTPTRSEMDIISWDKVIDSLQSLKPDVVLNCAGMADVDLCEKDDFAVRKTNVEGPRNLAQCSARFECKFVHISSNYIFDGQKVFPQPYFEDDSPDPLSAYGLSKKESEIAVRENSPNYLIVRSGWLYSIHGNNFIKSVVKHAILNKSEPLKLVDDQLGAPTWAFRLAMQIRDFLRSDSVGTYHVTAEGHCSPFEYGGYILGKLGIKASIEPCSLEDLDSPAKRPLNCLLENRLAKKQGFNIMVDWKDDLDLFLDRFGEELIKQAGVGKK